jgi:hypothetical protein
MSGISEGLVEVGQGALTARAVEPDAGEGGDGHTHESACLNCGTVLVGTHCYACGQAAHVHRTLGAFFHDLLHGVFHFEGKIWRTLPLLAWRPGKLTREYIDGRRASYVSPIALFLFFVFLMFAVFHATENETTIGEVGNADTSIAEANAEIGELKAERAARVQAGEPLNGIDGQIAGQQSALDAMRALKANRAAVETDEGSYSDIAAFDRALKAFKANPDLAAYKLQTYAYKYSWALIPISVPFLWLLFPFSRRFHLYDHTVFVTYSLCFMTLLVIVAMLLDAIGLGSLAVALMFVPPIHLYRQLKGGYVLSRWGALWRTVMLVVFANVALGLFVVLIMAQTSGAWA